MVRQAAVWSSTRRRRGHPESRAGRPTPPPSTPSSAAARRLDGGGRAVSHPPAPDRSHHAATLPPDPARRHHPLGGGRRHRRPRLGPRARPATETPLLRRAAAQLQDYFDGARASRLRPAARAAGHALPPPGLGGAAAHPGRRDPLLPRHRAGGGLPLRPRDRRANGANPIPILIPCHRVVAADGSLGGYSGAEGQATKRYLLELERRALARGGRPLKGHPPMIHAIRVHEHGGPEKLVWEEIPRPEPKPGEALVRHEAVGPQLHRRLFPHRALQGAVHARDHRHGGRRRGGGGGRGRGRRRSRATAWPMPARSAPMPRRASVPADRLVKMPGRRRLRAGRGDDAPGHDGAVPDPPLPPRWRRARPSWCTRRRAASG